MSDRVIPFRTMEPFYLTPEEFDRLQRDVEARFLVGDVGLGERILAKMIIENSYRYHEVVQQNAADAAAEKK